MRRSLLLLHGANGCSLEMQPWARALAADFDTHCMNLAGHGGRALPERLDAATLTDDVVAQIQRLGLQRPLLLGYSFGGVLALRLAAQRPELVSGVVTVASKWCFDAKAVGHACHLLQVPRLSNLPHRYEHLSKVHLPNDWRELVLRLHAMYRGFLVQAPLTPAELGMIRCPLLVLSGSGDPLVSSEECVELHRRVVGSRLALYRGPAHPADRIPLPGLRKAILTWAATADF